MELEIFLLYFLPQMVRLVVVVAVLHAEVELMVFLPQEMVV
jgi:hypothetical protein